MRQKIFLTILLSFTFLVFMVGAQETGQNETREPGSYCSGLEIGEVEVNTSVENQTLTMAGLYCASTSGYSLNQTTVNEENGTLEVEVDIDAPEEDEVVLHVITPVNFAVEESFEPETEELRYTVQVGNETIKEETEQIGNSNNSQETSSSSIQRVSNWLSDLFRSSRA